MAKKGRKTGHKKVHAGKYVHDERYAEGHHDLTPWVEVNSSRMRAIRYDYANDAIQVEWGNGNPGYIYREAGYEMFRRMIRSASKGRFINNHLNFLDYGVMSPDEQDAPSNPRRGAPMSGARRVVGTISQEDLYPS